MFKASKNSSFSLLQDRDEGDDFQEEVDKAEVFSRRKLESNWDRYAESEKQEPEDDTPTQRGTDYHVLLESAGKIRPVKPPVKFNFAHHVHTSPI